MILYTQPHADHYGHVLAMTERENAEDHHFEPVSARAGLIKARHNRRKLRRLRKQRFSKLVKGASNFSLDSTRTDKTARTEKSSEADADVSDQEIEPFGEHMSIPISDLSYPITAYSPPAVFTPHTLAADVGDIPVSETDAPIVYRPEAMESTDIMLDELSASHGQVILQTSKETDV